MNKKKVLIPVLITGVFLAAAGCDDGTYRYEVSGTVQDGQIDYDCAGHLSMGPVSFVTGKGRGSASGTSSSTRRSPRTSAPRKSTSSGLRSGGGKSASKGTASTGKKASKAPKNKGVQLTKKPDKPERITSIPKVKYRSKPHGCKVDDYELFIASNGGLYEQDVRSVDYDKCLAKKFLPFPACTTN